MDNVPNVACQAAIRGLTSERSAPSPISLNSLSKVVLNFHKPCRAQTRKAPPSPKRDIQA
eukprot:14746829-Alexandrium_andersonii.AAC.1